MKKLLALSISAILLVSAFSACQSKLPEDDSLVIENNYLAAECAESKMTSDGAGLYFCYSPYNLHYIDTDTQNAAVLCSKPDCPHYVENPGIESLDCFAQMIYDQGGNLYYYQEKLYYTILGGIQTDAVLAQANPTGTETKTLVKIQDTLTDTISAYQSSHSGAVVTGITPQILGAHNGKLYIKATVSYSISQNGTSSFQDQSVFLFYDCADGSTGQLENEEIQAQLDSGIPVYAVLSGNRMICLFTQKDQAAETLTATRENTYQLISVNLDSQKVEKTLDFDDVGIMELHLTQSGDFYLTEDVTDSENHTRTYYEYGTELEQKDEYTLDLNQFNSPWRLDNDLICAKMTPGVYALLGPNGAGKSTLMNIIVDNLRPNQGRVLFNGEDTLKLGKEFRRQLGYMPQQQGAYHDFTAKRFLWYMAALCGLKQKQAKERIADLLELVGLTDVQNQSIGSFSGGMKQRVFIAQALLNDPKVLILDEPTAGLDPKERIRIRNFISEISMNKIVIFATHVVSDIEFIAKEILLIRSGKLLLKETPTKVLEKMEHKVFSALVSPEQLKPLQSQYRISNIASQGEKLLIRIVSDTPPVLDMLQEVPPALEDLYLYYFADEV